MKKEKIELIGYLDRISDHEDDGLTLTFEENLKEMRKKYPEYKNSYYHYSWESKNNIKLAEIIDRSDIINKKVKIIIEVIK